MKEYISPAEIYAKYVDSDSNVVWPEDQREKTILARAIFGSWLIAKFDSWIDYAIDFIENPKLDGSYPPNSLMGKRDQYFRSGLKNLTQEQKDVVKQLVLEMVEGALFSALVTFDQTRYGQYLLSLQTKDGGNPGITIPIAPFEHMDLHEELNEWVLDFSKHKDMILEVIETKVGKQFSPISPYA